ncbi:MAG: NAD(P)/FAD-dependent oxidoreductase [Thermodesulfobacteriota bacterium]
MNDEGIKRLANKDSGVHIVGAGPASLVAAINLARAGMETVIHEQKRDVGSRFNGDFQGIENWSTNIDALEFLSSIGVTINFLCEPYSIGQFYGPSLKKHVIETSRPLFYMVKRGTGAGTLDQGLKRQAIDAGVKVLWNDKVERARNRTTIVGTGPRAADMIAKGIIFRTPHPDSCYGFLDNRIAPKGYAYLLVNNGDATFATVLYEDFQKTKDYFLRALEIMKSVVDIEINGPKEFGGYGNFVLNHRSEKKSDVLLVGEAAGFQDALWGFGLRYAMLSGYLAAKSILTGTSYFQLCEEKIMPMMETSLANRWLFAHLGNYGYDKVLSLISRRNDIIEMLQRQHTPSQFKSLIFQLAKQWYHTRLIDKQCLHRNCDCVWCRRCEDPYESKEVMSA